MTRWLLLGLSILASAVIFAIYKAGERKAHLDASEALVAALKAYNEKLIIYATEMDRISEENKELRSRIPVAMHSTASIVKLLDESTANASSTSQKGGSS